MRLGGAGRLRSRPGRAGHQHARRSGQHLVATPVGLQHLAVGVDPDRPIEGELDGPGAEIRDAIARFGIDQRAFALTRQRTAEESKAGAPPGPASAMFKYYATELNKRRYELMLESAGTEMLGWEGEGFEPDNLRTTRDWLRAKANTIEGGTSEIQLNIIAKRVLGLPD